MSPGAPPAGAAVLLAAAAAAAAGPLHPPGASAGYTHTLSYAVHAPARPPAAAEPCTDCHPGVEADSTSFQGLTFLHASHVTLEGTCARCHVDHMATGVPPGVTIGKGDCQACHHDQARRGTALCERCHEPIFAESVTFQGRPFNHSVHVGDFTGLGCADCHGEADEPVVASPPVSVCVTCHP